jgi:DNA repair protein RecO
MHHIHHTEAFVIGSSSSGEESKYIILMTKELGLIYARAQGVRRLASKLRFALEDFSYSTVSLVRGKEMWRIVNAMPHDNLYHNMMRDENTRQVIARVFKLVRRMVSGESAHPELFTLLKEMFSVLEKETFTGKELIAAEALIELRVLAILGYAPADKVFDNYIKKDFNPELIRSSAHDTVAIVAAVNDSLKESQL